MIGNFELVVSLAAGGLGYFWREDKPDASGVFPWHSTGTIPGTTGAVDAVTMIQSRFSTAGNGPGNMEVVARIGDGLQHFWREDKPDAIGVFPWHSTGTIPGTTGVSGTPALVQSRFGIWQAVFLNAYLKLGGWFGPYGDPTSDIQASPNGGLLADFADGSIYWTQSTGAHGAFGPVHDKFLQLGGPGGFLGYPLRDTDAAPNGGMFCDFQGGSIYWSQDSGAHEVHGEIRRHWLWLTDGGPGGFLGYPTTDESPANGGSSLPGVPTRFRYTGPGRFNHFEHGSIYFSPTTGAQETHGAIHDKWAQLGWERSHVGYPINDALHGGIQGFQDGVLVAKDEWNVQAGVKVYCRDPGPGCDGPVTGGGSTPTMGLSAVEFFNCQPDGHTVYVWALDATAGSGWENRGSIPSQRDSSGICPGPGSRPLTVALRNGHEYQLVAVDPDGITCDGQNDPTIIGCQRWSSIVMGSDQGPTVTVAVG
jgi:uncharacterized protein with LGFP repeats